MKIFQKKLKKCRKSIDLCEILLKLEVEDGRITLWNERVKKAKFGFYPDLEKSVRRKCILILTAYS